MTDTESAQVARLVSQHLIGLHDERLLDYLKLVYNIEHCEGMYNSVIHVHEVQSGNLDRGELSSIPVRMWMVYEARTELSEQHIDMKPYNAASDSGHLWPCAIIKFFVESSQVLPSECIGIASDKSGERILICNRLQVLSTQSSGMYLASPSIKRGLTSHINS